MFLGEGVLSSSYQEVIPMTEQILRGMDISLQNQGELVAASGQNPAYYLAGSKSIYLKWRGEATGYSVAVKSLPGNVSVTPSASSSSCSLVFPGEDKLAEFWMTGLLENQLYEVSLTAYIGTDSGGSSVTRKDSLLQDAPCRLCCA